MQTTYWLGIFLILLLIELFTMGLTTVWFAMGAFFAFLAGLLGGGLEVQVGVFFVSSLCLLLLTRPWATRYFNKGREKTNADRLLEEKGIVLEEIDGLLGKGRIFVKGQEWAALAEEEQVIEKGAVVKIKGIQGVKLIVRKEG